MNEAHRRAKSEKRLEKLFNKSLRLTAELEAAESQQPRPHARIDFLKRQSRATLKAIHYHDKIVN